MMPIVFGDCRGWFHPARGATATARGVVLCAPYGYDVLCTHRGWRRLAEQLAAAGMPALRFDYPGTGDSAGDEAPHRIEDWIASIGAASDWLRKEAGVAEIALCGLRLGAILAAASAARRPGTIAALTLLASPSSGRAYQRQLTLVARIGAAAQLPNWLESAGFRLHETDLHVLRGLDLGASLEVAGVRQILMVSPPRQPALGAAALTRLRILGSTVEELPFDGHDAYLTEAHLSRIPDAVFTQVVHWSFKEAPRGLAARRPALLPNVLDCTEGVTEKFIRFGRAEGLVGVLCEPAVIRPAADAPAVIVLNTGVNYHIGKGRLAVRLARRLAVLGTTSLRVDATGIGDSAEAPEGEITDRLKTIFDATALDDVHAALDALEKRGFTRCVVVGVCSGAHNAFHAALRDTRIVGLALANLPAFDRRAGGASALDGGPPPGEVLALRRPRMLLRRLAAEADRWIAERLGLELGLDRAGHWLRTLQQRRTTLLLAYSAGDRGLRELRAHFGRGGRHLPRNAPVQAVILDGSDHSLNPRSMQQDFLEQIEAHLRLHHGLKPGLDGASAASAQALDGRWGVPILGWRPRPAVRSQQAGQERRNLIARHPTQSPHNRESVR